MVFERGFQPAVDEAVRAWVEEGGLLLRFAGPTVAAYCSRPTSG